MSASIITIIIVLIIIGSVAVLFISQAREKARTEKIRRINALHERYRRLQRFLSEIPPQYLNKDLRTIILQRSISTLNDLMKYKSDDSTQTKLKQDQESLKQTQESTEPPTPVPIKDEANSKEIIKLLKLLYRFIERMKATKKIDQAAGKKYLLYTSYLISKTKADLEIAHATKAFKNNKPRVAIHNYHNAIAEMMRIKTNPLAIKAINSYKVKIKELEDAANEQAESTASQSAAPVTEGGQESEALNKEWDSFLDDDDGWQKKNQYDD